MEETVLSKNSDHANVHHTFMWILSYIIHLSEELVLLCLITIHNINPQPAQVKEKDKDDSRFILTSCCHHSRGSCVYSSSCQILLFDPITSLHLQGLFLSGLFSFTPIHRFHAINASFRFMCHRDFLLTINSGDAEG